MSDALHDWQNFFVLMGGASATLTGLMFVAVSLGTHLVSDENMESIQTYVTPSFFHFVAVLLFCGIMLLPSHTALSIALLTGILAVVGLQQVVVVMKRMWAKGGGFNALKTKEDNHRMWHGLLPLAGYTLALIGGVGQAVLNAPVLLYGLAATVALLLICAIHNTWILVLWIARQR